MSSVIRRARTLMVSAAIAGVAACGDAAKPAAVDSAKLRAAAQAQDTVLTPETATRSLAKATGAAAYRVDGSTASAGTLSGTVRLAGAMPVDSVVTPDRDSTGCRPFEDVTIPRERGRRNADSTEHDISNAVVWLVGVTHGPAMTLPRRVSMVLDGCHFEPRVLLAPVGATIMTSNRDDMLAKVQFVDHGVAGVPREEIGFTDPGQLVPSSKALAKPGLLEVRDEKHAWVRGYVAVAPHPFVAVTDTDGKFVFEGVPAGTYQLVAWHERLGAVVLPVRVEPGVGTVVVARFVGR